MRQGAPTIWSRTWLAARLLLATALPVVVVGAWANSYALGDWLHYYDPSRPLFVRLSSDQGRLSCSWRYTPALYGAGWDSSLWRGTYASGPGVPGAVLGFHVERRSDGARVQVPYWFLAALAAVPAVLAWGRRWRHVRAARRVAANRCAACGYDLRASAGRCPECGLVAVTEKGPESERGVR